MKTRWLCMLFALAVLTGCGRGRAPDRREELSGVIAQAPFSAQARLLWRDAEYQAELGREEGGTFWVSLRSAGLSSPVEYRLSGGALTIRQGEHLLTVGEESAPAGCVVISLRDSLSALSRAEPREEDGWILLDAEGQGCSLALETENYGFHRIELRDGSFEFQSFEFS